MNAQALEHSREALLALVEDDRRARIARIEQQAAGEAAALLGAARDAARARLAEAHAQERRRLHQRLEALEARLATGRRLACQRRLRAELEAAWSALPAALRARWADPARRREWLQCALAAAVAALGAGEWRIAHAPGLDAGDSAAIRAALAQRGIDGAALVEDAALVAGLAVHAGANTLDATLRGLLADRAGLAAQLAAALGALEASP